MERSLAEDMPKATAKNTLRRAAINAMKKIENHAKGLAPRDDGDLIESIKTKNVRAKRISATRFARSEGVTVATGPSGKNQAGGNAAWQEFGTVKNSAQPYMRPAADAQGQRVIDDIREELATQINKALARIAKKASKGK